MITLLSCAKTMGKVNNKSLPSTTTMPLFQENAVEIATHLSQFSIEELETNLHVNAKIAVENYKRYQMFHSEESSAFPALLSYTGIVFKRLNPRDFSADDFEYAQQHLLLTSFCYGLLRPLDQIKPYRLEGDVRLPELGETTMYEYWRSRLTTLFINRIKEEGGVLVNLASEEMKSLFDWKAVERSVRVVTPEFKVWRNDKLTTIVIYTKMARGEMARKIVKERIEIVDSLKDFSWEGFTFQPEISDENKLLFVMHSI